MEETTTESRPAQVAAAAAATVEGEEEMKQQAVSDYLRSIFWEIYFDWQETAREEGIIYCVGTQLIAPFSFLTPSDINSGPDAREGSVSRLGKASSTTALVTHPSAALKWKRSSRGCLPQSRRGNG
jgi:hypothetical protein